MTNFSPPGCVEFDLEGELLGFVWHHGKPKYLRLRLPTQELQIKLCKALRHKGVLPFQPGEQIRVMGQGKFGDSTRQLRLKATQIFQIGKAALPPSCPLPSSPSKPKLKLLVCRKSGCLKRGKSLWEALDRQLHEHNLHQQVVIEPTGCLKRCSTAPSLAIKPGNHHYQQVRPEMLPQIVATVIQKLEVP